MGFVMTDSATARGWGSGWPTNRSGDMTTATGGGVSVVVHMRIAKLVSLLLGETKRRGYYLHSGWCWGYANRPIKGTSSPSNHSWGLAIDLNAPTNPMQDHLKTDMPSWMPELWESYGFRWGGHYDGRKDAMHYEFMGTPAEADAETAKAMANLMQPVPNVHDLTRQQDLNLTSLLTQRYDLEGGPVNFPVLWRDTNSGNADWLRMAQGTMRFIFTASPDLKPNVTGIWDQPTEAAVITIQKLGQIPVSMKLDFDTWKLLRFFAAVEFHRESGQ
jgi:hypothetical protein